jgi:hydroxyethylthiazole kinase
MISSATLIRDIGEIRRNKPLVHNITNYVVMNITANALLAAGASPVMAHAKEEVAEMASVAGSLVINIGTLSPSWVEAMEIAQKRALERKIPVVLDPVGAGATKYRTEVAVSILSRGVSLVRGNASEIMALAGAAGGTKGVDSTASSDAATGAAKLLLEKGAQAVCISGETDYIISETETCSIANGHPMMPQVTGLGCTATALCGAFLAVNKNAAQAAAHAMGMMGIAGEIAAEKSEGPGSFVPAFLDALYNMQPALVAQKLKLV